VYLAKHENEFDTIKLEALKQQQLF
jgi:hypothetical protein